MGSLHDELMRQGAAPTLMAALAPTDDAGQPIPVEYWGPKAEQGEPWEAVRGRLELVREDEFDGNRHVVKQVQELTIWGPTPEFEFLRNGSIADPVNPGAKFSIKSISSSGAMTTLVLKRSAPERAQGASVERGR